MVRRTRLPVRPALCVVLFLTFISVSTAVGQHDQHAGHGDMAGSGDVEAAWRMPPMGYEMPMLPGLHGRVPTVEPFLPGAGMDPAMFPEAVPTRVVRLDDGDTLRVEAALVRREIAGRMYVTYAYNGQVPGPILRVRRGSAVTVHFTNRIEMPSTIHWHGLRLDNRFDGIPGLTQDPVAVGETFTYELTFPDAGVYWYHPHVREDLQQDLGLYGNMLVDDEAPGYYGPAHREAVWVLDDMSIDRQGMLPWGAEGPTNVLMGRFGNVLLVNGTDAHRMTVRRDEIVRFYLTNVANSRTFNVVFAGASAKVIASDVSRYEREQWTESVPIAPAERYIVDVRFETPGHVAITNTVQAINHFRGEFFPSVDTLSLVTVLDDRAPVLDDFEVLRAPAGVSEDIARYRPHFDRAPDHTVDLTLRIRNLPAPIVRAMEVDTLYAPPMEWNDAMPMMNWLSGYEEVTWVLRDRATGRENMDIRWDWNEGDVVKVRVFNDPTSFHPMHHPIHVHGQRFLVTALDGVPTANLAWKDTAIVPVGSTMDILIDASNPGDWMLHCHIAEHLQAGMMLGFRISAAPATR